MFPTNQNFVSANAGLSNGNNPCFPAYLTSAPTAQTIYMPYGIVQVGQIVVVPTVGAWICIGLLAAVSGLTATWEQLVTSSGNILAVTGTANQITATTTAGTVNLTIPATFIAPGSIASTTTMAAGTALSAGTTITATLGNITATNGNLVLGTAGNKIVSTSVGTTTAAGANSFGSVTLVGGTATIATTAVTANSLIKLSRQSIGATGAAALGQLTVGTISAGTSFVINAALTATATSLATTDVSVVNWEIVN